MNAIFYRRESVPQDINFGTIADEKSAGNYGADWGGGDAMHITLYKFAQLYHLDYTLNLNGKSTLDA